MKKSSPFWQLFLSTAAIGDPKGVFQCNESLIWPSVCVVLHGESVGTGFGVGAHVPSCVSRKGSEHRRFGLRFKKKVVFSFGWCG